MGNTMAAYSGRRGWFMWAMVVVGILAAIMLSGHAMADDGLHSPGSSFSGLLELIHNSASTWSQTLEGMAKKLFWGLALIQLVWTFAPLLFRKADIGDVVSEFIRFIMIIGFWYALMTHCTVWAESIIDSFRQAGAQASLGTTKLYPGDMMSMGVQLADTIGKAGQGTWNPFAAFSIALAGVLVLISFAFIAAFMALTIIESYVVINAAVLFTGFGGSQWTREYAMAMVRYAVSVGAKLFVLTLIVGLVIQSAKTWQAAYTADSASMWTMIGLAITCAYLCKSIPEIVAGIISGSSPAGGSALGGITTAVAAGAAAAMSAGMAAAAGGAVGSAGGSAAGQAASGITQGAGAPDPFNASPSMGGAGSPSPFGGSGGSISGGSALGDAGGAIPTTGGGQAASGATQSGGAPDPFNATPSMPSQSEEKTSSEGGQPSLGEEAPVSSGNADTSVSSGGATGGTSAGTAPKGTPMGRAAAGGGDGQPSSSASKGGTPMGRAGAMAGGEGGGQKSSAASPNSSQNTDSESAGSSASQPSGPSENGSSQKGNVRGVEVAQKVAHGAVKSLGLMAALTVPGAEQAAGLGISSVPSPEPSAPPQDEPPTSNPSASGEAASEDAPPPPPVSPKPAVKPSAFDTEGGE